MNDSLRPKTKKRNWLKCTYCREQKQKCVPAERDWDNSQQKCNRCEADNRECGPNVKCSEDPVFNQQRQVVPENESGVGSRRARKRLRGNLDGSAISSAPAPTPRGIQGINDVPPSPHRIEDERQLFDASSVKDLKEKAKTKLHEFHVLEKTLEYVSQSLVAHCHVHGYPQSYHDLRIEDQLHHLFRDLHRIAVDANDINETYLALWIHSSLVSSLDRHPRLVDNRKRYYLLKIAVIFQELGHQWDYEQVLQKIASIDRGSDLPDLFPRLTESLSTSSQSISCVLRDFWNETVGGDDIDPNLNLPPLHAAVQHRQPSIIREFFSDPSRVRVNTEERDLNGWTALFAAAANGDESCCRALLENNADVNTRDKCGHTALEVAVRSGSLNVVECLTEYNVDVNPDNIGCSSLPLHAAIENQPFNYAVTQLLLNFGAEVTLRRFAGSYTDGKNAIEIARSLGHHQLAQLMQEMVPSPDPTQFLHPDYTMGQTVS